MKIITRKEAKAQGLKRYFTGKPCKHGHVEERHVSSGSCLECNRQSTLKSHAENRDKVLERNRQYREENPEYFRQYREENRDKILEYSRQYHAENRERRLEQQRQYREKNLEYFRQYREENREYFRQHREENRELYAAYDAKRRAAKIDRTLPHEEELTDFVLQEAYQQAKDMEELFGTPFHVDHMIPMQGEKVSGLHVWNNLQVIPAHLNTSKGNRMRYTQPLEWLADSA